MLRAVSERKQNAVKAITNLVTIIDSSRANLKKAESDIRTYTAIYNKNIQSRKDIQQVIMDTEVKISQISSAINNMNAEIANLNGQAGQTKNEKQILIMRRTELQNLIAPINNQKATIQAQIDNISTQIRNEQLKLQQIKINSNNIKKQITENTAAIADLQNRYTNI